MNIRSFTGCSEISDFDPQTKYFHEKVNFRYFETGHFWGCEVENWIWWILAIWIWSILWNRVKIGYTRLFLTFFNENRPYQPIYRKIKKVIFRKKMLFFNRKSRLEASNWPDRKTTAVPGPHQHSLKTYNNRFLISQHWIFAYVLLDLWNSNTAKK